MCQSATRLTGGLLLAIALAACVPSRAPPSLEAERAQLANGQPVAAQNSLRRYLVSWPDSADARLLLGEALLAVGDAPGAEVELRRALQAAAARSAVVPLLARALIAQQKDKALIDEFGTANLGEPAAQDALLTALADAWARQGERAKARGMVDAVLARSPQLPAAQLALARLEATEGRLDAAMAMAERVVAKNARNADALETLAQFHLYGKKDLVKSDVLYQQLLTLLPNNAAAHSQRFSIAMVREDKLAAAAAAHAMQAALPKHPQSHLVQAQLAIANKDFGRANELLANLLKAKPDNVQVLMLAGQTALELNAPTTAVGMLQKVVQLAPESVLAKTVLARTYLRLAQPARALQTLGPVVAKSQDDVEAIRTLADAELMYGQVARAEELYRRALKLKPEDGNLRVALAMIKLRRGQADVAVTDLRDVVRTVKDPVGDVALISVLMRQRKWEPALQAIDGLERKLPQSPQAELLRGHVRLAQGDRVAAKERLTAALARDPNYLPAVQALAGLDVQEGKFDQARAQFAEVLKRDPRNVAAMLAQVDLLGRSGGSPQEIMALVDQAVKVSPTDPAPRLLQVRLLSERRDLKSALSAAQAAASALPDNPDIQAALGRMQLLSGDANQAVSTLSRLIAKDPQSAGLQLQLADAYVHARDLDAAERAYRRALELSPGLTGAQRGLIALSVRTKSPARALDAARALQRQQPQSGVGYMLEGDVHAQFKDWDAALRAYRAGLDKGNFVGLSERVYAALGQSKGRAEAQQFADDWLRNHPEDAGLSFLLGNRAVANDDFAAAERYFAAAHKASPRLVGPLNNLAWISAKLKRPDAVTLAQQAVALAPGEANTLDTLVFALTQAGRQTEALEAINAALAKAPQQPVYRFMLARAHADGGNKAAAKAELDQLAARDNAFSARPEVVALRSRVAN